MELYQKNKMFAGDYITESVAKSLCKFASIGFQAPDCSGPFGQQPRKIYYQQVLLPDDTDLKQFAKSKLYKSPQNISFGIPFSQILKIIKKYRLNGLLQTILQQSKQFPSENQRSTVINFMHIIQRQLQAKAKIFRVDQQTFVMTYYEKSKQRQIKANIKKFYQQYVPLYARYAQKAKKNIQLEQFSAFLVKKLVIRCIQQALQNNKKKKLVTQNRFSVNQIFNLMLGGKHHSVMLKLTNFSRNVNKSIFQVFWKQFGGYNYSIVSKGKFGMIIDIDHCQWTNQNKQESIDFQTLSGTYQQVKLGLTFYVHLISEKDLQGQLGQNVLSLIKQITKNGFADDKNFNVDCLNPKNIKISIDKLFKRK